MGNLLNDVNILITKKVGDLSRLEHIKETIENNKQLYDSDRTYVDELIEKYLFTKKQNDNKQISKIQESKENEESITIKNETKSQELFCGNCGTAKDNEHDFCPKCGVGTKPQEESFCPKCGNKVIRNNPCSNCNHSQQNLPQQTNSNRRNQRPYEWKSEGTTLILTIILGIIGLGGIGHIYLGNITRGIVILIVGIILLIVVIVTFGIGFIVLIPFAIWVIFDARKQCRYYNDHLEQTGRSPW